MIHKKSAARGLVALGMIGVGLGHFLQPEPFVAIVPTLLPAPLLLVYLSGFFEIAGGVGLLVPRLRVAAAWGLIALYLAVFPANINMAIHHIQLESLPPTPEWALWARLPVQGLFVGLAYWFTRPDRQPGA